MSVCDTLVWSSPSLTCLKDKYANFTLVTNFIYIIYQHSKKNITQYWYYTRIVAIVCLIDTSRHGQWSKISTQYSFNLRFVCILSLHEYPHEGHPQCHWIQTYPMIQSAWCVIQSRHECDDDSSMLHVMWTEAWSWSSGWCVVD